MASFQTIVLPIWAIGMTILINGLTDYPYTKPYRKFRRWRLERNQRKLKIINLSEQFPRKQIRRLQRKLGLRKAPMPSAKKKCIDLEIKKKGFNIFLTIKVAKEIEDYFRKASERSSECTENDRSSQSRSRSGSANINTSDKWFDENGEGLEFYKKNVKLSNKVSRYTSVIDNFGNGLMDGSCINLALLRTVGISGENGVTIHTDDLLGYEEMREYAEQLATWTKRFYEDHIRDQDLAATITFEVDAEPR